MKVINNFKRLISVIVVVSILIPQSSTSASILINNKVKKYVALGDSISVESSDMINIGYVTLINNYLKALNPELETINLSKSGITSEELLKIIIENKDKIKNANVITVSIGGNNILKPLIKKLEEVKPQNLNEIIEMLNDEIFIEEILSGINDFKNQLPEIIKYLSDIAPNAEIYINNLYNPFEFNDNVYQSVDRYIVDINNIIYETSLSQGYKIIDTYSNFCEKSTCDFNLELGVLDVHPNNLGHAIIADKFIREFNQPVELDIDKIYNTSEKISGKTAPNTKVIITSSVGSIGSVEANKDGIFSLDIEPLKVGTKINILVYDKNLVSILYNYKTVEVEKEFLSLYR